MPRSWVSLGSNQNREYCLRGAIAALRKHYGPLRISPVYESPAFGFSGSSFYNLVAGFMTEAPPQTIAATLHAIEGIFGRVRSPAKFVSRTLDLDLLTWGDQVLHQAGLELPRSDILRYAFVLRPLAEVAGDEQHPVLGQTYRALWASFNSADQPLSPVDLNFADDA
jgi:2-amino-4-hydroxy-6-hydroxymethyldihydropteridine diphosphokinase